MKKKIALIFGGSGQDGTFLSYILLKKNYKVICVSRRKKKINNHKILNIHKKIFIKNINYYKQEAIKKLIINSKCQEIYFLSGLSRPVMSFKKKNQTLKSNIYGKKFYHLGPKRDEDLIKGLEENKTSLDKCDFILCTGLFDNNSSLK